MAESTPQKLANPAPLGLFGFGMTTILLNLHNAGFYGLSPSIMSMGIFFGGIAQIIAGILEYKRGNTFGMVAFVSYGSFWLTLVGIWLGPKVGLPASDPVSMGWYLTMWGVFTFGMYIGTRQGPRIGRLIFGSLAILFGLLALANFTGSHFLHTLAGFEGIACGGFAFYEALAIVVNEKRGKVIFPV